MTAGLHRPASINAPTTYSPAQVPLEPLRTSHCLNEPDPPPTYPPGRQ